jgi:hypothetical protein
VLYFHSALSDRLLQDTVAEILVPMRARGVSEVNLWDIERPLKDWIGQGRTARPWGATTLRRVAQELLATLRDFGVLQGATKKRLAPTFLPLEAFAYVAFFLKRCQPSGAKLIELPDWRLFFLSSIGVERLLFECHQEQLLDYHVAGSVSRLTFPADTLEEYAHVLTQR